MYNALHQHGQDRGIVGHRSTLSIELDEPPFGAIFEMFVYLSLRP